MLCRAFISNERILRDLNANLHQWIVSMHLFLLEGFIRINWNTFWYKRYVLYLLYQIPLLILFRDDWVGACTFVILKIFLFYFHFHSMSMSNARWGSYSSLFYSRKRDPTKDWSWFFSTGPEVDAWLGVVSSPVLMGWKMATINTQRVFLNQRIQGEHHTRKTTIFHRLYVTSCLLSLPSQLLS